MKIMSVVGARPNFMKVAPIIDAINRYNQQTITDGDASDVIKHVLVHTGQHYGKRMSDSFFEDLNLPVPDIRLNVGSESHAAQTAEIMKRFEGALAAEQPDILIVAGDVNSTLACALVGAKASFDGQGRRPLIAHVEAGLRSFDRSMPEEVNRILTDHISDLLFVTEESAMQNLAREGICREKMHFVGNTMIDCLFANRNRANESTILERLGLHRGGDGTRSAAPYLLLTLHRPSNVDNRLALVNILEGVQDVAREYCVVFPAHPRTRNRISDFQLDEYFASGFTMRAGIHLIEPLGYLDFLCLMEHSMLVITDSGGIQEETTCLGVACATVRENTERPVTIRVGTNTLAGTQPASIRAALRRQLHAGVPAELPPRWDGRAAERLVDVLTNTFAQRAGLQLGRNGLCGCS